MSALLLAAKVGVMSECLGFGAKAPVQMLEQTGKGLKAFCLVRYVMRVGDQSLTLRCVFPTLRAKRVELCVEITFGNFCSALMSVHVLFSSVIPSTSFLLSLSICNLEVFTDGRVNI